MNAYTKFTVTQLFVCVYKLYNHEPSGGPKGARSATIFSSRCFKSICFSICESLHYASVPSVCFFESKDFTVDIIYFDRTIL